MKSVDELRKEALEELVYESEQAAKIKIKSNLAKIVEQQKIIVSATNKIAELRTELNNISIEKIEV